MDKLSRELKTIITELKSIESYDYSLLNELIDKSYTINQSWSGSILGYHSKIYYKNFQMPPHGTYFSQDWGINNPNADFLNNLSWFPNSSIVGSVGDWREYEFEQVKNEILQNTNESKLQELKDKSFHISKILSKYKTKILSILYAKNLNNKNEFLLNLINKIQKLNLFNSTDFLKVYLARFRGEIHTRDQRAVSQDCRPPAHIIIQGQLIEILSPFLEIDKLIDLVEEILDHLEHININPEKDNLMNKKESSTININGKDINVIYGDHNQQTIDNSLNQTSTVFADMRTAIQESGADKQLIEKLIELTREMQENQNTSIFQEKFKNFMSLVKGSTEILGAIAPFLPVLTELL